MKAANEKRKLQQSYQANPGFLARSVASWSQTFLHADANDESVLRSAQALQSFLEKRPALGIPYLALAAALDHAAVLVYGKPLHALSLEKREAFLAVVDKIPFIHQPLWLFSLPLKIAYLMQGETLRKAKSFYGIKPGVEEPARWRQQIQSAAETESDIELEAEVAVVGTGAGGAAAAHELASRGIAVVLVEAGDYYHRGNFDGKYFDAFNHLYKFYPALGNGLVSVMAGQAVGGTTLINSGTCFRTPDKVLKEWRLRGLSDFTSDTMSPHFATVENMLGVEEATAQAAGPVYDWVKKGAASLGMHDVHRLSRNAPGCDGQGMCQYGCPTAAKKSTDVSFIPAALKAGAFLYTGFTTDNLLRENGAITGITAVGKRSDGSTVRLRIKAPKVIISMGTMRTPVFLQQQGIRNPHLGHNLTVHPTGLVGGVMDGVDFRNANTIPQGVGIGDLAHEGIRFEGGTPPLGVYGLASRTHGRQFRETMDNYPNTGFLGFMVSDSSKGTVRAGYKGYPLVTYWVNQRDLAKYVKGMATLGRLFFRAGAKQVNMVTCNKDPILSSEKDVDRFEKRNWRARDFMMTAYHPLGTARLGVSAEDGVCDSDHQVFGVPGLYVMDGSNVPSSLGVNPQITIMAMATRAAQNLAESMTRKVVAA